MEMRTMNDFVYKFDIIFKKWNIDFEEPVPEPNWSFQAAIAHSQEVVDYIVGQYFYEQQKEEVNDDYNGVEFQ
jgi:hypothetical protein